MLIEQSRLSEADNNGCAVGGVEVEEGGTAFQVGRGLFVAKLEGGFGDCRPCAL